MLRHLPCYANQRRFESARFNAQWESGCSRQKKIGYAPQCRPTQKRRTKKQPPAQDYFRIINFRDTQSCSMKINLQTSKRCHWRHFRITLKLILMQQWKITKNTPQSLTVNVMRRVPFFPRVASRASLTSPEVIVENLFSSGLDRRWYFPHCIWLYPKKMVKMWFYTIDGHLFS